MRKITIKLSIIALSFANIVFAAHNNFNCPQPSEITSTDFTQPSIWVGPPMPHSVPGIVGVGLGGKEVKDFIGAQEATVNHKPGWVCVYHSKGGLSILELYSKIKQITEAQSLLKKYSRKVESFSDKSQPFLKNYPQNEVIGFVGYQKTES